MSTEDGESTIIKVFLDTNRIASTSFDSLFGMKPLLQKLTKVAEIILPKIVFEEMIEQKARHYRSKYEELSKNQLLKYAQDKISNIPSFEEIEKALREDDSIPYTMWDISDKGRAFEKIYDLAIKNKAPFEKGSDKGFKDACIALTVLDYSDHFKDEKIALITKDTRLRDFFHGHDSVKVYQEIEELLEELVKQDDSAERGKTGDSDNRNIITTSLKGGSNQNANHASESFEALVSSFCLSHSFQETHSLVARLKASKEEINQDLALKILKASINNQQINWIISDEDVSGFLLPIFRSYEKYLSDEEYAKFVNSANLPNERTDSSGNALFSRSESEVYQEFADALVAHIQSRNYTSSYKTDSEEILSQLQEVQALSTLDDKAANWNSVAGIFISGIYTASNMPVNQKILLRFIRLLQQSPVPKREAIIKAIDSRIDSIQVDFDIPF